MTEQTFLHELFEQAASARPDDEAVVCGDQRLRYATLNESAERLARRLRELIAGPEPVVAVLLPRGVDLVVAMIAVWKAGGVYLPVDPALPRARRELMVREAGARVLVHSWKDQLHVRRHDAAADGVIGSQDMRRLVVSDAVDDARNASRLAYITYTSGSSGRPKAVGTEHRNAVSYLRGLVNAGYLASGDVALQMAAMTFDASIRDLFGPLTVGGRSVIPPLGQQFVTSTLHALIAREGVTLLPSLVPATLRLLCAQPWPDEDRASTVRLLMVSGERLPTETVSRASRVFPGAEVVNHYGPTECTMTSTFHTVGSHDGDRIPVGMPLPGTDIRVLDDVLRPVRSGEPGEVWIGGAGVTRGYLNQPSLTARSFMPDPYSPIPGARMYRTGDLGRWDEDGRLDLLGRVDEQLKLHGFRFEAAELDGILLAHPDVADAAVRLVDRGRTSPLLVAYVVDPAGRRVSDSQLMSHVRNHVPEPLVPHRVVRLAALPRTVTGKLDRARLPDPERVSRDRRADSATELDTASDAHDMLGCWQRVLGADVGMDDDFIDLGGDSISGMALLARVHELWGVRLTLRELFAAPTPALLSARVRDRSPEGEARPGPSAEPGTSTTGSETRSLSFAEERLWFFEQLLPGTPLNTIPVAVRVRGDVRLDALAAATSIVISRHDALRTRYTTDQGVPGACLDAPGDIVELIESPSEADLSRQLRALAAEPVPLDQVPLMRLTCLRRGVTEHVLLLRIHHLVADAWSVNLFWDELSEAYDEVRHGTGSQGSPPPPAPTGADYAAHAARQRDELSPAIVESHLAFWRSELDGAPALIALPWDRPRPSVQRHRGAKLYRTFPASLSRDLEELARNGSASTFMVLLAGWASLLGRYTGQEDVVVGVPSSGRESVEHERAFGLYVNMLPVRIRLTGRPGFRALVRRVRDTLLRVLEHRDLPFEKLVESLRPDRELAYSPIFQVLADLQAPRMPAWSGMVAQPERVDTGTARFDISVSFAHRGSHLEAAFTYDTDLFEPATIESLADGLELLLVEACAEPDTPVDALPLVGATELAELTDAHASPGRDGTLIAAFVKAAVQRADAVALTSGERSWTYSQLLAAAADHALALRTAGVVPGSVVAVCLDRGPHLVAALLGVHLAGCAYSPLDPTQPPARLSNLVRGVGAAALLTADSARGVPDGIPVVVVDERLEPSADAAPPEVDGWIDPQELAYLIHTSGSTGEPKCVEITQAALLNLLADLSVRLAVTPDDVLVAVTTVSFDIAALELFLPLLAGARLVVSDRATAQDPIALAELVRREAATILQATPATWEGLVLRPELPHLRVAMCGGEQLSRSLAQRLLPLADDVYNLYGPTETTIWSTISPIGSDPETVAIGRPLAGTTVVVLDERLQPVPPGVHGEIYIAGAGVARGYRGRPGLTAQRFLPFPFASDGGADGGRLYRTGDWGRRRRDGTLEYLRRVDRQLKVRGFRVEPAEVEAALADHPAVVQALVVGHGEHAPDRLVAYVVTVAPIAPEELRRQVSRVLPAYLVPETIIVLDAFPLTPNGKVDTASLPEPSGTRASLAAAFAPARTDVERRLAGIVGDVLGAGQVGIDDDFFDLGGHSLLAVRVSARASADFDCKVTLEMVFTNPTVRTLAARIEEAVINQLLTGPS
ncbi:amino acid adenylation domain-containing protein [Monashia sp. NPDC004114]